MARTAHRLPATGLRQLSTGYRQPATALLVIALLFSSCAVYVVHVQVCDTLYFGTAKADGSAVTDADWQRFLADEVSKHFPDGFTTWEANGQWRTKTGQLEHERTHIVQIIHADSFAIDGTVGAIIDSYKKAFAQESVLRVRAHVGVAFR